jgi:hypothetical protein
VRGQTLAIERGQHTAIGCDAPDWVMALATEALNLAARALDEQVRAS